MPKNPSSEGVISILTKAGGDVRRAEGKGSHTKVFINGRMVIVPRSKE